MGKRILIRHGQSKYNTGETDDYDSDNTERGTYQIQEVALHLKEVVGDETDKPWLAFVSPYLRCLKTALPIHKRFGIKIAVDNRVGEIPDDLQRSLKRGVLPNRMADFPDYDWSRFPNNGVDVSNRQMPDYLSDLESFVKDLPEYAIIITHLMVVKDLTDLLTCKSFNIKNDNVPNCSVTLIEDDCLVFIGKK